MDDLRAVMDAAGCGQAAILGISEGGPMSALFAASYPDRALATVLFTDIVDSTATAARLGDRAWRDLIERHDATVRHHLHLHRGHEVKTMGDGFLATFDGPARAIRCATSPRDALSPRPPHPRQHPHRDLQSGVSSIRLLHKLTLIRVTEMKPARQGS